MEFIEMYVKYAWYAVTQFYSEITYSKVIVFYHLEMKLLFQTAK